MEYYIQSKFKHNYIQENVLKIEYYKTFKTKELLIKFANITLIMNIMHNNNVRNRREFKDKIAFVQIDIFYYKK